MIVTVTPNPSVDRTMRVSELCRGGVHRATGPAVVEPSGKGVNVSRALATNGHLTRAVLPTGGAEGRLLLELLDAAELHYVDVPIGAATRGNLTVLEPDGTATKFNEPGASLRAHEGQRLLEVAAKSTADATWAAGCGSLPPGAPTKFYADLVRLVHAHRVPIAVDTSGPAFGAALAAGPDVVKPNLAELAEYVGVALHTIGDAVAAARELQEQGARAVLVSLGAHGALLVDDDVVHGEAPIHRLGSAVGAGDTLLAGFIAGGGVGPAALIEGLAWAAAACRLPASSVPQPDDIDRTGVLVYDHFDPDREVSP